MHNRPHLPHAAQYNGNADTCRNIFGNGRSRGDTVNAPAEPLDKQHVQPGIEAVQNQLNQQRVTGSLNPYQPSHDDEVDQCPGGAPDADEEVAFARIQGICAAFQQRERNLSNRIL